MPIDFYTAYAYNSKHKSQWKVDAYYWSSKSDYKDGERESWYRYYCNGGYSRFSRGNVKYPVDKGMIEKSSRGVYILPEIWEDEMFN